MTAIKNKIIKIILMFFMLVIANFIILKTVNIDFKLNNRLVFDAYTEKPCIFQIFYRSYNEEWSEENSVKIEYTDAEKEQKFKIDIPQNVCAVRVDTGDFENNINIKNLMLTKANMQITLWDKINYDNPKDLLKCSDISGYKVNSNEISFSTIGTDPYFVIDFDELDLSSFNNLNSGYNNIVKYILCAIVSVMVILISLKYRFALSVFVENYSSRKLIWRLSVNDFKTKYAGSFFGIVWAFVQPVITIVLYWFVFQVGFRSTDVGNCPFVLWLMCGLVPWFFFSDSVMNAANSMLEYSYLVKKVVFRISILPIVKIMSAFFVHLFFMVFTIIIFACYGYYPQAHTLQVLYYTFSMFALVLGISYATCAMVIFFRDLGQIINILLQIGMWLTPIMWHYSMLKENQLLFFKLNPMFYIVQGYRDSLIDKIWFWQRPNYTIIFWIITIGVFGIGSIIFKRLKLHFADVL